MAGKDELVGGIYGDSECLLWGCFFIMQSAEQGKCVSILSLLTAVALIAVSKLEFDKQLIESKYSRNHLCVGLVYG